MIQHHGGNKMAKKISNEVKDVLYSASVEDKKDTISKEAESKLEQQLKREARESSKYVGGLRI